MLKDNWEKEYVSVCEKVHRYLKRKKCMCVYVYTKEKICKIENRRSDVKVNIVEQASEFNCKMPEEIHRLFMLLCYENV